MICLLRLFAINAFIVLIEVVAGERRGGGQCQEAASNRTPNNFVGAEVDDEPTMIVRPPPGGFDSSMVGEWIRSELRFVACTHPGGAILGIIILFKFNYF